MLYSPDRPVTAEGATFATLFKAQYHVSADHWSALGYDAAMLVGRAVHDVGPRRAAIHEWFGTIGKSRPPHPGVTGSIAFDDHRDPVDKQVLVTEVIR